jgi:hypothetical protein
MAERIVNGYKRLFEVRLLHHYWLDDGSAIFDTLPEIRRNKLLLAYDSRSFLEVKPSVSTVNQLKALRGVFKNTAPGFVVAVPKATIIPDDTVFSFIITVTDHNFFNYTAITFISHEIFELYYPPKDKIVRYKENVPVFSNLTGVSRGANPNKSLFLSKEFPTPASTDKAEFLNINAGALVQLTSSQPGAATQQINANAANMPVFFHQNDTPDLVPPAGLAGVPEKGIMLSSEIPDNVFGLIHIAAINPSDSDFSYTNAGIAKDTYPVFQVRFKSRSAYWKYLNKNSGVPVSETSSPLPLTAAGNAGVKKKPGDSNIKVQFESNDPTKRIEKIYTEIFE